MSFFSKRVSVSIPPPGPTESLQTKLLGDLSQMLFDFLGREPTDEELQGMLEPIFSLAARRGGEDIQTRAIELAGRSGLNLSDTPVANVALRQQRELTEGLQASRAQAMLNLRQQALENRFRLGQLFETGIGTLGGLRTAARTITSTPSGFEKIGMITGAASGIASGVGGFLQAPTLAAGLTALSDREVKEDIRRLGRRDEAGATEALREMPSYSFRFRDDAPVLGLDGATHVGPMAGEGVPAVRTAGGKAIDLSDRQGRTELVLKDIDARLRKMKARR